MKWVNKIETAVVEKDETIKIKKGNIGTFKFKSLYLLQIIAFSKLNYSNLQGNKML